MHSSLWLQRAGIAIKWVLAPASILSMLLMGGNLLAQDIAPDPADGSELVPNSSDFWLLSDFEEVALYSLDGELLGVATPGTWFKSIQEEDGWALVYSENDPETLVWILLAAVDSIDLAAEPPSGPAPTQLIEQPTLDPGAPISTVTLVPTITSTPTTTATPGPSATPVSTSTPTPTVPTATAPVAPTAIPTIAPDSKASPTAIVPTATPTTAPATATTTSSPAPTQAPASASVDMRDNSFSPANTTIRVGGTITWTNRGAAPHTATKSGAFDSGVKNPGQTFAFTFNSAGTYPYVCQVHTGMSGTVIVQ